MQHTFGIEEEFMLVNRHSLAPVHIADDAIRELQDSADAGTITSEFLPSQVEHATTVCLTLQDAESEVFNFRRHLADWAERHHVLAIGSGTPFQSSHGLPVLPSARYERIAHDVGRLANEHLVNGLHVHVGIDTVAERVCVLNGLRPWLPLLLAMSANSPFWAGADTGHHSWRAIQTRRWTTNGIPPFIHDVAEYQELHDRLIGVGATQEYSATSWAIRLSEHFPTVEVRACDSQLSGDSTVALGLIVRALAAACVARPDAMPHPRSHLLDAELWHAARYGMSDKLYDPPSGEHAPAATALASLVSTIAPQMTDEHSRDYVDRFLAGMSAGLTGAMLQRRAFSRGVGELRALYRESLSANRGWSAARSQPPQPVRRGVQTAR